MDWMRSRLAVVLVVVLMSGALVVQPARAIIPAAVFMWMGASTNMAMAIETSLYIHAGAFAVFDLFLAEKGSDGKPAGNPVLTVKLNPNASRSNPDPSRWDDPAPGERDVTPKLEIAQVPGEGGASEPTQEGQAGYVGNSVNLGTIYGSSPEAMAQADANYAASTWGGIEGAPTYSVVGCGAGVCDLVQSASRYTSEPTYFTMLYSAATIPQGKGCGTGVYADGFGCVDGTEPGGAGCPEGYASNGSNCTLTNPEAVKKPEGTPCEVLRTSSGLATDARNPACEPIQFQAHALAMSGQSVSINANNSVSVATPTGQTTLQLGNPNPDGSVPVLGASRSGNPAAYQPGSSSGGTGGDVPSCGGPGQPACSSGGGDGAGSGGGGGGGSCGGPGQPACRINDDGFSGLGDPTSQGKQALDDAAAAREDALRNETDTGSSMGISFAWVPRPGNLSQECAPLPVQYGVFAFEWNWCPYLDLLKQAMGYLFYIFAGLYIWRSFMGSNSAEAR